MSMLKLGPVRQVGYIVKDIEKAMREWITLSVGPWFYTEKVPVENFMYMGKPSDVQFAAALANSGDIQIELIQQLNDAPSLYRDFLASGAEGIQHISHWLDTEEFENQYDELIQRGFIAGHEGTIGLGGRFVYFINRKIPGTILEVSEMSGLKGEYFRGIAEICTNWDGTDPIRR
ncbi:MAG TPA: VOC family protein [Syntrophorhabdaceae bacterium]|nr:VOC family protein [Syntrophorhabdaceae bacterium]